VFGVVESKPLSVLPAFALASKRLALPELISVQFNPEHVSSFFQKTSQKFIVNFWKGFVSALWETFSGLFFGNE